ncbi:E1-E2_ATPase domain-containing protein/Cation_ATPase_C domain-containing protein/Cation_ATPase_N domain-containing protein/Hydrolase domain-containing protein [Cephalotus follicularis]|uniref:P-type Ca(2+) transporter n=1 Tax=Cephalotus follicularis TaxID=3775 RepID=A0A1Q3BAI0_CEPFO|nr:E1-E2_ATPase domain-containing protein/Cation_ATPase_C domain-containing protein/Cation_ATPase_N domain-containing protein/Hydrolase domain-containing protein [Cephalotus follicularis]
MGGKGGQGYSDREMKFPKTAKIPKSRDIFPAWAREITECEHHFQVDKKFGLPSTEVKKRQDIHGFNELVEPEAPSFWSLILGQFNDTLVRILLGAALISFVLAFYDGEGSITAFVEPLVIFLILIVNSIVGVWQERNAEKALEALKEIQSESATVIRDGKKIHNLPSRELVVGDVVEVKVGDKIPADMRVLELVSSTLRVEQGSLTGESEAVNKTNKAVIEDADITGKKCMVFAGTTVANGSCVCLVTQKGMDTEIGQVHDQIHVAAQCEEETPLKKKLNEFGESLTRMIGVICVLVWVINVKHCLSWEYTDDTYWPKNFKFSLEKSTYYFQIAVALAVAAIPEGLPTVITTCLALGTRKMAKKNALVRKLPSVETLGCTTVICSDKTGTLTTNQMAVAKLVAMGATVDRLRSFKVEGTTYSPYDGKIHDWPTDLVDANLQMISKIAAVCNDASIAQSAHHKFVAHGMPTEAALKVLVEKMGLPEGSQDGGLTSSSDLLYCSQWWNKHDSRIATLEFDRDRKSMGVIVNSHSGKKSLLVKGAVENLLDRTTKMQLLDGSVVPLYDDSRNLILKTLHEMSTGALRCLGFAYKDELPEFETYDGSEDHPAHELLLTPSSYPSIESDLVFVGMVGLRDPPREEVYQAISDCRAAGIRVIVITGDNKNTAEAICREIGVFGPEEDISKKSLIGKEFIHLNDMKGHLRQSGGLLFSRAEPRHKQEIVRLLKEDGEVVAMTGDGVNDAPALKMADIGIAMGITGTEVAKEASDMVLADDNFSTIVAAVGEGRSIYNNMKAFIRYMISSNIGEVASIFLTAALGIPEGLIAVHLLWVNLVTDGPPATALGFNPPDKDIMKKPPRRSNDSLISAWILFRYLVIGLYVGIATVGVFIIWYTSGTFIGIDLSGDGHTLVSYSQLANWGQCSSWDNFTVLPFTAGTQVFSFDNNPCDYFQTGKVKAMTLSLSVLVAIEMFNSLNALSEDGSLLTMPPWVNPWLLLAMFVSFGLHCLILYVPFLASAFGIVPLSFNEWLLVLAVAFPVILIDEILKFAGRYTSASHTSGRRINSKPKSE